MVKLNQLSIYCVMFPGIFANEFFRPNSNYLYEVLMNLTVPIPIPDE